MILVIIIIFWFTNNNQDKTNTPKSNNFIDSDTTVLKPSAPKADEKKVIWEVYNFADDSIKQYVMCHTQGIFYDSVNSESKLFVEVLFSKTASGIFLHKNDPANYPLTLKEGAEINLKNQFGGTFKFYSNYVWNQEGGLRVNKTASKNLRDFLIQSFGEVEFVIKDYNSAKYKFKIITTGFAEAYSKLK